MRPMHPCAVPNCSALVRGTSRCPTHTISREQRNPKDPAQAKFYGSTQWKAIRRVVRARDPICKRCHRRPTTNVNHIDGDWTNNPFDYSNHEGLCDTCDRKQTGAQHYKKRKQIKQS